MIDVLGAAVGLALTSPIVAGAAAAVRLTMGRPVLFRQVRLGQHGGTFTVLKFRTMTDAKDELGELRPDRERLTRSGRLIRSLGVDELPQLWNVLRGEMSLVGPRPLLPQYLPLYTAEQARRHSVLPGITGWAQVNGRNLLAWEDRFVLDVWYVEHWSLGLDVRILFRTVGSVLARTGVSHHGHPTMPNFEGQR